MKVIFFFCTKMRLKERVWVEWTTSTKGPWAEVQSGERLLLGSHGFCGWEGDSGLGRWDLRPQPHTKGSEGKTRDQVCVPTLPALNYTPQ